MYLHECENWTEFTWDAGALQPKVDEARLLQGKVLGFAEGIGFDLRQSAEADAVVGEVIASSLIEGVVLDESQVRSSVAKKLGLDAAGLPEADRSAEGAVAMMLDAVGNFAEPVTAERLFGWHNALFPTGRSGLRKIEVAAYRKGSMRVVSGAVRHERTHFEAPDASAVPEMMDELLGWMNSVCDQGERAEDPLIRAGIAHLWFLTIHPFDDGNGRIARALTELLLSRSDGSPKRYYSMAGYILEHREEYYAALEQAQKGGKDITSWLVWFLEALEGALVCSLESMDRAVRDNAFWVGLSGVVLNDRQQKVLAKLRSGFEGKLTAAKWGRICKVSHDTALRDIKDLMEKGILQQEAGGGRSTSYRLVER